LATRVGRDKDAARASVCARVTALGGIVHRREAARAVDAAHSADRGLIEASGCSAR
jgi:hypothetical protein